MTIHPVFTIHCPGCSARYPVDSGKVPGGGVRTRCGKCSSIFVVESAGERVRIAGRETPGDGHHDPGLISDVAVHRAPREQPAEAARPSREPPADQAHRPFVASDAADRAARLARVLVSDMIAYHRDRYDRALARGTLKEDFAEEVRRSWAEYVRRVGQDLAHGSRYFQDELNATLARGEQLF